MRKEFFDHNRFDTIEETQAALDAWVIEYNNEREHQSIGDVPPIRRFELARPKLLEVIDGEVSVREQPVVTNRRTISRIVDSGGRISVLTFRYHVGRHLAGETVIVESKDNLLHVTHNGVVVATHAKRHLADDDVKFGGRPKALRPAKPTNGSEVIRVVDCSGSASFAGAAYRVGNRFIGKKVGVRLVGDTIQIVFDNQLIRTHEAKHDKAKEFGAFAQPNGKPRRTYESGA